MNRQGKNKIDWTAVSWNVITGCNHNCSYCYAKRMAKRLAGRYGYDKDDPFKPTFHLNRLHEPINWIKSRKIFVSSMGDMWGKWVHRTWIDDVLDVCSVFAPWHTYQFLTKNPRRYAEFKALNNCWYGTTDDGTKRTRDNISCLISAVPEPRRFVSFEPLLNRIEPDLTGIQWVIIGADSTRGAKRPPKEWADVIIKLAREQDIPVFVKNNYHYPVKLKEMLELGDMFGGIFTK